MSRIARQNASSATARSCSEDAAAVEPGTGTTMYPSRYNDERMTRLRRARIQILAPMARWLAASGVKKACYRRPGESPFTDLSLPPPSRRRDGVSIEDHPDLAAEKVDQDRHALVVGHPLEYSEAGVECPLDDPDLVAAREARAGIEMDKAALVVPALQLVDHARRDRGGMLAVADEMRHADGRLDRTPTLGQSVDGHEHVAREQRSRDRIDAAGMAALLEIARQIDRIALTRQVSRRLRLGMRLGVNDIPLRIDRHETSPRFAKARASNCGIRTRSAPKRATAAAAVARVVRLSVTRTASTEPSTSSKAFATGTPTKRGRSDSGSTTPAMVMPVSSAQIAAISARSETPRIAMRENPRARAVSSAMVQSFFA